MKYAMINSSGNFEIRNDSAADLPVDAVELTDDEYDDMLYGKKILLNGVVVANPDYSVQP